MRPRIRIRIRARRARARDITIPRDERHVAIGSLAGIIPAEIAGYVLVAIDDTGWISLSGDQCSHGRMVLLASAMNQTAAEVAGEGHGGCRP